MSYKVLYVMVGIPGSGKSTYVNVIKMNMPDAVVLSTDDYLEEKAVELGSTYAEVFDTHYKEAEKNIHVQLKDAVKKGLPVIWDQTNLRIKKRKTILSYFPDDYKTIGVFVNTSLDVAIARAESRAIATGKVIPKGVIVSMYNGKEAFAEDEGFDVTYIIDGDEVIPVG